MCPGRSGKFTLDIGSSGGCLNAHVRDPSDPGDESDAEM